MPKPKDDHLKIEIVEWEGRICCIYVNDFRVAGGKPWGGGKIIRRWIAPRKDMETAMQRKRCD